MGQNDVGKVLKKHYPEYISYKQVMKETGYGKASTLRCLKLLEKRDEVEFTVTWGKSKTSHWQKKYRVREEKNNGTKQ